MTRLSAEGMAASPILLGHMIAASELLSYERLQVQLMLVTLRCFLKYVPVIIEE